MLGKLIKNEWKSTYKLGIVLVITTLGIGLVGMLTAFFMLNEELWRESDSFMAFGVLTAVTMIPMALLALTGITYGFTIFLAVRFYKSMYSDEGYLSHTLPVSTNQLLFSKLFVGGTWMILISIATVVTVILFCTGAIGGLDMDVDWRELINRMGGIYYQILDSFAIGAWYHQILVGILLLITPFFSLMTLFGGLSLGQLVNRHRGFVGLVFYLLILFAANILRGVFSIPLRYLEVRFSEEIFFIGSVYYNLIFWIVVGVAMYFVAYLINEKNLNLE